MTKEAAVKFELDSSLKNWTKFTSPKVVVSGFKWFVNGEYIGCGTEHIKYLDNGSYYYSFEDSKFALRNAVVHCAPVKGKENSIWSCEAKGGIVAFASSQRSTDGTSSTMTHSKNWSQRFTFHNPKSAAMAIDFHKEFSILPIFDIYKDGERMFSKLELRVEVISHNKFDVYGPQNKMIKSPDDAAKVIVDGKTLWLSKEVLGGACPFFHAYFNNDFKEKRDGEFSLTDVKLVQFMRFLAIIYGVDIDLDKTSLQYLLRLEDKFECGAVRSKCHTFLVATDTLTHQEKLGIGDRFRFDDVIKTAIEKIDVHNLMAIGQKLQLQTYSHKTTLSILKAVSVRHSC